MTMPSMAAAKSDMKTKETREILVVFHVAEAVNENQQAKNVTITSMIAVKRIQHPAQLHGSGAEIEPAEIQRLAEGMPAQAWQGTPRTRAARKRPSPPMASDAASRRRPRLSNAPNPAMASGTAGISHIYLT